MSNFKMLVVSWLNKKRTTSNPFQGSLNLEQLVLYLKKKDPALAEFLETQSQPSTQATTTLGLHQLPTIALHQRLHQSPHLPILQPPRQTGHPIPLLLLLFNLLHELDLWNLFLNLIMMDVSLLLWNNCV